MARLSRGGTVVRGALLSAALIGVCALTSSACDDGEGVAHACNPSDLAPEYGVLDLYDVVAFIHFFTIQNPRGDLDGNGLYDLADVMMFVENFEAGCP